MRLRRNSPTRGRAAMVLMKPGSPSAGRYKSGISDGSSRVETHLPSTLFPGATFGIMYQGSSSESSLDDINTSYGSSALPGSSAEAGAKWPRSSSLNSRARRWSSLLQDMLSL